MTPKVLVKKKNNDRKCKINYTVMCSCTIVHCGGDVHEPFLHAFWKEAFGVVSRRS
jgi:hypothetical protein